MDKKTIITSWPERIDVDALWCGLGLCEIKRLTWGDVALCLSPVWWPTVIPTMNQWIEQWQSHYEVTWWRVGDQKSELIIVDTSDYNYLTRHYFSEQIVWIIDHHMWSEKVWYDLIGDKAQIEPIGACATQITEIASQAWVVSQLQEVTLKWLYCAIISNTLNFQAEVTHQRDHIAAELLLDELKTRWYAEDLKKQYFEEQDAEIQKDPIWSLIKDTKFDSPLGDTTMTIGQLEVWDGKIFIDRNYTELKQLIESQPHDRIFISIPSIGEWKNYILCDSDIIKTQLEEITWDVFVWDKMITTRLWLRKEFIRDLLANHR